MIKVALTDDDAGIRKVVRQTLTRQPDMELLWEAEDGLDALERTDDAEPDVMVMDIDMPRMNGLETLRQILKSRPTVKVVMFSGRSAEELAEIALGAGALGWVCKSKPQDLPDAIRAVHLGCVFIGA